MSPEPSPGPHEAEIVSEAITLANRERAIAWRAVCRRCGWSGPPRLRKGLAEGDQADHAAATDPSTERPS